MKKPTRKTTNGNKAEEKKKKFTGQMKSAAKKSALKKY